MGYALCLDRIIRLPEDGPLCFRPLRPGMDGVFTMMTKDQLLPPPAPGHGSGPERGLEKTAALLQTGQGLPGLSESLALGRTRPRGHGTGRPRHGIGPCRRAWDAAGPWPCPSRTSPARAARRATAAAATGTTAGISRTGQGCRRTSGQTGLAGQAGRAIGERAGKSAGDNRRRHGGKRTRGDGHGGYDPPHACRRGRHGEAASHGMKGQARKPDYSETRPRRMAILVSSLMEPARSLVSTLYLWVSTVLGLMLRASPIWRTL